MKIGLSEAAARKTLAIIPCTTNDQDLIQLRDRLEIGLKAATAGGHLDDQDLKALIWAAAAFIDGAELNTQATMPVRLAAERLKLTGPKLEALLARAQAAAGT